MHVHSLVRPISEEKVGPSRGPVVLDIGGDRGALVVRGSAELDGAEIEIRRLPDDWDGTHVAFRARSTSGEPLVAAVFASLQAGCHELRLRPRRPGDGTRQVDVLGGEVAEITWAG